ISRGGPMALVFVNGRIYFTKSIRNGSRVTSMSYGPALSEYARTMVAMDRLLREERRAERMRRQQERRERDQGVGVARAAVPGTSAGGGERPRGTRRLVAPTPRAPDYHRHARGQWRRRRTMSKELARRDLAELARLVAAGDIRTLEAIVYRAESELYRRAEEG